MKPPIPSPYGETLPNKQLLTNEQTFSSWFFCGVVIMCSATLLWLCQDTLCVCFNTIGAPCGTPAATASFWLLIAPLFLSLPFLKLLWAKNLATAGAVARGALTVALGIWVASWVALFGLGFL